MDILFSYHISKSSDLSHWKSEKLINKEVDLVKMNDRGSLMQGFIHISTHNRS